MKPPPSKQCAICGKTFHKTSATSAKRWVIRETCSNTCGAISAARKRRNGTLPPRPTTLAPRNPRDATKVVLSQSEVAERFGISRARVGQIEQKAFRKLRRAILEDAELRELVCEVLEVEVMA